MGLFLRLLRRRNASRNYQIGLDLPEVDHGKTYYQASLPVRQLQVKMAVLGAKDPEEP